MHVPSTKKVKVNSMKDFHSSWCLVFYLGPRCLSFKNLYKPGGLLFLTQVFHQDFCITAIA